MDYETSKHASESWENDELMEKVRRIADPHIERKRKVRLRPKIFRMS